MGYTYQATYYSSLQDSITSICKSILPFSLKKRRLVAAEQKVAKQQSDNLKWQQNCFHQILNLMGLQKEGIVPETQLSAFRSQLLETLVASQGIPHHEQPPILRDKLLFLQELLYAKCISAEEYHASKRPLLQRLAAQGAEIEARDIIVGTQKRGENLEEEWSVIDLRDDQSLLNKENSRSKNQSKLGSSAMKHIKDAASVLGFGLSHKQGKNKEQRSIFDLPSSNHPSPIDSKNNNNSTENIYKDENCAFAENSFWNNHKKERQLETRSILMSEGLAPDSDTFDQECCGSEKGRKETFQGLFHKKGRVENDEGHKLEEIDSKSAAKLWGVELDGLKRWKRSNKEDGTSPLPLRDTLRPKGGGAAFPSESCHLGQGPDTKEIRRKLLSDGSSVELWHIFCPTSVLYQRWGVP